MNSKQIVFVDFSGGKNLSYDNGSYSRTVEMSAAAYTAAEQAAIIAALNAQSGKTGIVYTAEAPADGAYSTIYVGSTDSFDDLGTFKGLSETIDAGNLIADDEAFVNTKYIASPEEAAAVIAHEAGHLTGAAHPVTTGTIADFAALVTTNIQITDQQSYSGQTYSDRMYYASDYMSQADGGVFYITTSGVLTGSNLTFTANQAGAGNGGAIYNAGMFKDSGSSSNNKFTSNKANYVSSAKGGGLGGAFYNDVNGTVSVSGTLEFTGNSASYYGGAIYNAGDFTMAGGTFSKNSSSMSGSAIYGVSGSTFTATGDVTFSENTENNNGAVYAEAGSTFEFQGKTSFTTNTTSGFAGAGGAIYNAGTITFKNTATFTGNTSKLNAGAVYNTGSLTFEKSVSFTGNEILPMMADKRMSGAGALNNYGGNVVFKDDVTFDSNIGQTGTGTLTGGAIHNAVNRGSGQGPYIYGTIEFYKTITLTSSTDTWTNEAGNTVNWNITGGPDSHAKIVNYQYVTNWEGTGPNPLIVKQFITVSATQAEGSYVLATGNLDDYSKANNGKYNFTITGAGGDVNDVAITVGQTKEYNKQNYSLAIDTDKLVLTIATPKPEISYLDENGETQTTSVYTFVTNADQATTWDAGYYVVGADYDGNGVINADDAVYAKAQATPLQTEFTITGGATVNGDVKLIVADGFTLTVNGADNQAGITVSGDSNFFTVYGQKDGTGTLNATGGKNGGAGIGGGIAGSGSNITINGGTVTATGETGAGIGGGSGKTGSNITINGGTVTATGETGAGIGGGLEGSGSDITINGGTVTATSKASGIGSGYAGDPASNIKVNTALTVKADSLTNPPTTVITNTGGDLAESLASKKYATVTQTPISDATITVSGEYTYDGKAQEANFTVTMGETELVKGTDYTVEYSNNINAGEEALITVTGIGAYTGTKDQKFTIKPKELTVSGTTVSGKIYDGKTNATVSYKGALSDVIGFDKVEIDTATGTFEDKTAGKDKTVTVSYTLKGDNAANYTVADGTSTATIDKRTVLVEAGSTYVYDKDYDGNTTASVIPGNLQNTVEGDSVILSASGEFKDKNAGTNKDVTVKNQISGLDADNYILITKEETLQANIYPQKLTVAGTTVESEKVYDGNTDAKVTAGSLEDVVQGDNVSIETATGTYDTKDAGEDKTVTVKYTLQGNDADNYILDNEKFNSTITKREITLTSGDATKVYDGTPLTKAEVTADNVVKDEGFYGVNYASQTEVGSTSNTFEYKALPNTKEDNYIINVINGGLIVTATEAELKDDGTSLIVPSEQEQEVVCFNVTNKDGDAKVQNNSNENVSVSKVAATNTATIENNGTATVSVLDVIGKDVNISNHSSGSVEVIDGITASGNMTITNDQKEGGVIVLGGDNTAKGLTITNATGKVINGGTVDEKEQAAKITVTGTDEVIITNDGHLNANVTAGGKMTITNTSANTLIGSYSGQDVDVTNTADGAAEDVTLQAYGKSTSETGTVTITGLKSETSNSKFTGTTLICAGYAATPSAFNNCKGTVKLAGTNTFSGIYDEDGKLVRQGNLFVKAKSLTADDASTLKLDGVKFTYQTPNENAEIAASISTEISGESSIYAMANGTGEAAIFNGNVTLKDGVVLGKGTNVKVHQDSTLTQEGTATFKDGAKVDANELQVLAGNTLNVDNATLKSFLKNFGTTNLTDAKLISIDKVSILNNEGTMNVFGETTFTSDSMGSKGLWNNEKGVLNLEQGATLVFDNVSKKITNAGTINLKGGAPNDNVTIDNQTGSTLNWDLTVGRSNVSLINWAKLTNSGTLAITVDAAAQIGTEYTLAQNADESANDTEFTLRGFGYDETITVGGDDAFYLNYEYKLAVSGTDLVLTVVDAVDLKPIYEYQGGQTGQHTNNDNYTYYTKYERVFGDSFNDPGAEKGAVSYKWVVSDEWIGYENAWTEYDWENAAALEKKGVDLSGETAAYKFVYLAGYDESGKGVSMNIYQVLSDTEVPTTITEIKGDNLSEADASKGIEAGWANAKTNNKTVTYDKDGKQTIVTSTTTIKEDGGYTVTVNAVDAASGVAVTEPNGFYQKYQISDDGGENWTEYDQSNPLKLADGTYNDYKIKVVDKAGNETITDMSVINVDATDAEIIAASIMVYGNEGKNGWYTAAMISGEATDNLSGVAKVEYSVNGGDWKEATGTTSWSVTAGSSTTKDGDTYKFRVTDKAGNVSTADYKLNDPLKVDNVKAEATITVSPEVGDGDNGWYKTTPTYTVKATDDVSGIWKIDYTIDDGKTWTNLYEIKNVADALLEVTESLKVDDTGTGGVTYKFKVTDVAGNETVVDDLAEIKVDTIAPDMGANTYTVTLTNASQWDWDAKPQASKSVTEITKSGEWFTNRRDGGAGTFTLSGKIDVKTDEGSPVTPSIKITYEYQQWDNIKNEWVGVKTTETQEYSEGAAGWKYDSNTGDWSYDVSFDTVKNAAGTFTVEVSAQDEAGNVSATKGTFTGSFDNTIPSNPIVTLDKESTTSVSEAYSKTGIELDLVAKDGAVGGTASEGISQSGINTRYWATSEGKLDRSVIFGTYDQSGSRAADKQTEITFNDVSGSGTTTYWTDATEVVEGVTVMKEDAYNIAFYDQNEVGTYSTGKDSAEVMSYARYIVDRSAPILSTQDAPAGATTKDASGNEWYDDAGVTVTFTAVDAWKGTDTSAGYEDHVSGVNKFYILDTTTGKYEETEEVTKTITDAGDTNYKFKADDKAGNESTSIEATYRIDKGAPTYDSAAITGINGTDKRLDGPDPVYLNAADLKDIKDDVTVKVTNVRDTYDTAKDGGVGIDRNVIHTFYIIDKGTATEFTVDGANDYTSALQSLEDGEHEITIHYEDKLVAAGTASFDTHINDKTYKFTKDTVGVTIESDPDGTYGVFKTETESPFGPVKDATATVTVTDKFTYDYANMYDLTFKMSDATSGIASWTVKKGEEVIKSGTTETSFTLKSTVDADKIAEGSNEYTVTMKDKAGNETTQTIKLAYDKTIEGKVEVMVGEKAVTVNADGNYYVNSGDYGLKYTETLDGYSDANFVFTRDDNMASYSHLILTDGVRTREVKGKEDGASTIHNGIITDAAGNQLALDATVVVDTTKAKIELGKPVSITTFKSPEGAPTEAEASTSMVIAEGLDLSGEYTSDWFSKMDGDFVVTISDDNLSSILIDGTPVTFTGTSYDYKIEASTLMQGANAHMIIATDKAGNETKSTITLNYDNAAPVFAEKSITVGGTGYTGGKTVETATKVFVKDLSKFNVTLNATDTTSTTTSWYSYSVDGTGSWSEWATASDITTGEGYYRFASVDAAGNSAIADGYFYVTVDAENPANPFVTFKQGGTIVNWSTLDGDNQMTYPGVVYTEPITVDFTFTNELDGSDETHYYIAGSNFNKEDYNIAYTKAFNEVFKATASVEEANKAGLKAGLAATNPETGSKWKFVTTNGTTNLTVSGSFGSTDKTETYYFYSEDASGNVSRLQEITVNFDVPPTPERDPLVVKEDTTLEDTAFYRGITVTTPKDAAKPVTLTVDAAVATTTLKVTNANVAVNGSLTTTGTTSVNGTSNIGELTTKYAVVYGKATVSFDDLTANKLTVNSGISDARTTVSISNLTGTENADTLAVNSKADVKIGSYDEEQKFIVGDISLGDGNDTVKIGSYSTFTAGNIELGNGTNSVTVGSNSTATVASINDVSKLTLSSGATMEVTEYTGTAAKDTMSIGSRATFEAVKVDLGEGANAITVSGKANAKIGELKGLLNKLTVSSGTSTDRTTFAADEITGTIAADKLSIGNYADVKIGGDIELGAGTDTIAVGKQSTFEAGTIDFGDGTSEKFTAGYQSDVKLEAVAGVNQFITQYGVAGNLTKVDIAEGIEFSADATTTGNKLTIAKYSDVNVHGLIDFNEIKNTIAVGNDSTVVLKSDDAAKVAKFTIGTGAEAYLSSELVAKVSSNKGTVYDIGTADVAVNFTSAADETSDNELANARTLEDSYDGWLNNAVDSVDYLKTGTDDMTVSFGKDYANFEVKTGANWTAVTSETLDVNNTFGIRLASGVEGSFAYSVTNKK